MMSDERQGSASLCFFVLACAYLAPAFDVAAAAPAPRPNVLLIVTDDQGYGDLGAHGNHEISTPRLDALARQSVELANFYVCPVCSPTRASLMTGRYHYRTGVTDTFHGRSRMFGDEVTLAEALRDAGYRTAIFGKWHLGDNYPARPMDQGFEESLVHRGGGIGQPSDPPDATSYFDPILQHNGEPVRYKGYCSDIYTEELVNFLDEPSERPFFAYLAFNAPHEPLEVPEKYLVRYRDTKLLDAGRGASAVRRVYAMVSNIDENVGRVLDKLDQLGIARDTIVVFLTDNGPQYVRYNAGLRGLKGSVYEGGIRAPCYIRWNGRLPAGRKVDRIAAHVDLFPTVLDCCGASAPPSVKLDGKSLKPLLVDPAAAWLERNLFIQWHRGDQPRPGWACAVRDQRWKLVQPIRPEGKLPDPAGWELYDLEADPGEQHNLSDAHPDRVRAMRQAYDAWFADIKATRNFARPRIQLGTEHEDPTILTQQDRHVPAAKNLAGYWELDLARPTAFRGRLTFKEPVSGEVKLAYRDRQVTIVVRKPTTTVVHPGIRFPAGPLDLSAWAPQEDKRPDVFQIELRKTD